MPIFLFTVGLTISAPEVSAQPERRAERLTNDALEDFKKGKFKDALENCDKAIAALPAFAYAHYLRGWSLFRLAQPQDALAALNSAQQYGHNAAEVVAVRGQVYLALKDYANAEKDLLEYTRLMPAESAGYFLLGNAYYEQQDFPGALAKYLKAVELGNKDKNIQYYIAVCYGMTGDRLRQGQAAWKAINERTDFLAEAHYEVAQAFTATKKYDDAIKSYETARNLKPTFMTPYFDLSEVYRVINRFSDAVKVLEDAVKADPYNSAAHVNLSWIYSLSDRHQESIQMALKATKLDAKNYVGFTNLCRAYNDLKYFDSAIQACNDALKIKPGDGETYFYLARSHAGQNRADKAALFYKQAVTGLLTFTKDNPNYADGFYLLGNAYYSTNQRPKAIAAYVRSLELNPYFHKALYNLGAAYVAAGNAKSARAIYDRLLKVDAKLAQRLLESIPK